MLKEDADGMRNGTNVDAFGLGLRDPAPALKRTYDPGVQPGQLTPQQTHMI